MSLDGLDRLRKLQQLSKAPSYDPKKPSKDRGRAEAAPVAPSKQESPHDLLARIDGFKKGFDSSEDDDDEDDEDEEDKADRIPNLDLASIHQGSMGSHMYPTKSVDAAAIAAEYLGGEKAPALSEVEGKEDIETEPIKIRSVGEVLKGYRDRQRAGERQVQARHVRKIAAQPSYHDSVADKATDKKKKRKSKKASRTVEEDKSSGLDYLDRGDDDVYKETVLDEAGPVLLSNLNYTEFSSNYVMRQDMMAQCESILRSGRTLVLRTAPLEDGLDAKMLLRTMATDLAACTASEYCLPEITYDEASCTHEMILG